MSTAPIVPLTRTLPTLLRREIAQLRRDSARLFVATVQGVPDAGHVSITYAATTTAVPRLASYTSPTVGRKVYCLAAGSFVIALGETN